MSNTQQTNSLRLINLFKTSDTPTPSGSALMYFYNGSTVFDSTSSPKIFDTLTIAVQYFTEKTSEKDRTIGQFVTFAYTATNNWVVYIYEGSDLTDENYSNSANWKAFGESSETPYTDIQEILNS